MTNVDMVLCTYELSKASYRQPTGSRHKLKQTDSLLVVHLFHHLQVHNSITHCKYTLCVCLDQGIVCSANQCAHTCQNQ